MASKYSSPIHPRIIDPIFDKANFRCEFRFQPDTLYYSDIRLINVGMTSSVASTYQLALGTEGVIQAIHLMDGGTQLDSLQLASNWNCFKNLNSRNDGNISVNRYTKQHRLGFLCQGTLDISEGNFGQGALTQVQNSGGNVVNTTEATTQKGWLSLKDMLPMLRESNFLPTNLFRKLRLVIEYKPQAKLGEVVTANNANYSTTAAECLIDELADGPEKMEIMRTYRGVQFDAIESDTFIVSKIGAGLTDADAADTNFQKIVSTRNNIRGFNGKYLKRMLIQCQPTEQTVTAGDATINKPFSNQASVSLCRPEFQIRLNGKNMLPGEGAQGKNRRLAMLTDTYGSFNVIPIFNMYGALYAATNIVSAELQDTIGQADYTAMPIMSQIQDLQIELTRTALYAGAGNDNTNAIVNQELRVNVWGEVSKAIIVGPGGYNVVYV